MVYFLFLLSKSSIERIWSTTTHPDGVFGSFGANFSRLNSVVPNLLPSENQYNLQMGSLLVLVPWLQYSFPKLRFTL